MRESTGVLPILPVHRYVTPLREGGSLPAVVDTPDGLFVAKFRGAGQGPRALVAELLASILGRGLGLPIPEPALLDLVPDFGSTEPDQEIQDLLAASHGLNAGLRFLPSAFPWDPWLDPPDPGLASSLVWFDAWLLNVDRTVRNPNLLWSLGQPWAIDHGAALYFHHRWSGLDAAIRTPFAPVADHLLLPFATEIPAAARRLTAAVTPGLVEEAIAAIPDDWLLPDDAAPDAAAQRRGYRRFLLERLHEPAWVEAARLAQRQPPAALGPRETHRVE